jgi:hypothetical protein
MSVIDEPKTTEIRGEYDNLSGSFELACRKADAEYRARKQEAKRPERLSKSTSDAIDWLLKYVNDSERLRNFLEGRPEVELIKIQKYIAWKKSQ